MINTHHREKLINAVIYFAKNTKYCGKTKLLKLLYFLDFSHFKETGKSVTGLDYYTWEKGPVPRDLFSELSDIMKPDLQGAVNIVQIENFQKITPKKKFNDEYFSKRELKLLERWAFVFKEAKAENMTEVTHLGNRPWERTLKSKGEFKKIDYLLSIDDERDSISLEEAKERSEEISEVHNIFGIA